MWCKLTPTPRIGSSCTSHGGGAVPSTPGAVGAPHTHGLGGEVLPLPGGKFRPTPVFRGLLPPRVGGLPSTQGVVGAPPYTRFQKVSRLQEGSALDPVCSGSSPHTHQGSGFSHFPEQGSPLSPRCGGSSPYTWDQGVSFLPVWVSVLDHGCGGSFPGLPGSLCLATTGTGSTLDPGSVGAPSNMLIRGVSRPSSSKECSLPRVR